MRLAGQAVYSVGELATMAGKEKRALVRLLSSSGVEMRRTGKQRKRVVFVSELEKAMPELVDSIRFTGGEDE